jgi:hypothetical protein
MSPNNTYDVIIHWIFNDNSPNIMLVDNFQYDNNNDQVVVPDANFSWVDIYGLTHNMESRDGMPPLVNVDENGVINYYW